MPITRENYVAQSIDTYLRKLLQEKGYGDDAVEVLSEFPYTRFKDRKLTKTYISTGFDFDNGGKQAEMGSNIKRRLYTVEFFVFGQTSNWGRNVANAVKFCLENDAVIPLLNILDPAKPVIDALVLIGVEAKHEPVAEPAPWQENVWTVSLRVEDTYDAAAAVA